MGFSSKNTGEGGHALRPGILPTQEPKPSLLCLLHWQEGSLPLVLPGKPRGQCILWKHLGGRDVALLLTLMPTVSSLYTPPVGVFWLTRRITDWFLGIEAFAFP